MPLSRNGGCKGTYIFWAGKKIYEYFRGYLNKIASRAKMPMQKG